MSDKNKETEDKAGNGETAEPLQDTAPDAEFPEVDDVIRIEPPKISRTPLYVSLLSLVISGICLIGVAYFSLKDNPPPPPLVQDTSAIDALAETVRAGEQSVIRMRERVEDLANRDQSYAGQIDSIEQQLRSRLESYESLPGRMRNLEDTMSSIQGISSGVRDNWLLAEAEYYMQIANAQLQLASNPHLARLALLQADERIAQLANPALTNVRRTLSTELRALDSMVRPDVEGITLTLASLASVVDSLPLRQDIDLSSAQVDESNSELSGLDRAMDSLKSTISDVVSVRRTDENIRPLIAPESAYFLRANLSLQLQTARLALLRSEKSVFQTSLDDAVSWLVEFYDTESTQVQSAQQTLAEIRDSVFDISAPDISESLRLLRQFNTLSTPANRVDDGEVAPANPTDP